MNPKAGDPRAAAIGGSGILPVMASLIAIYAISQFLRNSIGVIAPDLSAELAMDASTLGLLSSVYFLSFAAAQIPVGIAIDRYGARTTLVVCGAITAVGTAMFALAPTSGVLIAARLLIGIGCSSFFMAPLAIYARRFPPERFASLTSIQLGAGSIGTLIATAPLAASAAAIGWRGSFMALAAITVIVTVAVMALVPRRQVVEASRESWGDTFRGVGAAMRVRSFWVVFFMHAATYSAFASVVGLWAGPWLADVHGADLQARGNILLLAAAAQITGIFAWGWADRLFRSYKRSSLTGAIMTAALLGYAALVPMSLDAARIWLVLFGVSVAYTPIVTAHGKSLFPIQLTGRGITLMNVGTMGGVFVSQSLSGILVAWFPARGGIYPEEAYRAVFAALGIALVVAILLYLRSIDPHPSRHAPQA
jgi:predicted MFS family arabinose efflux permease